MKKGLFFFSSTSKILVFFLVFLATISFVQGGSISKKMIPRKDYKVLPNVSKSPISTQENKEEPFNWTVEKVDEHLTKISIPPDPRMSTADELFDAMNSYRRGHSVPEVQKTEGICSIAKNRANEQLANGDLDGHAGFDKYVQGQEEFTRMGEVLFGGNQPQYGVHIVEYGWDRSLTGHKEAIQNPVWTYGCGGIAGYYAVFIFGAK